VNALPFPPDKNVLFVTLMATAPLMFFLGKEKIGLKTWKMAA